MTNYLEFHREEFFQSLNTIESNIERARNPQLNPYVISFKIHNNLDLLSSRDKSALGDTSQLLRKFHDFYGWKSKGMVQDLGLCSGAAYRTSGFLKIPPQSRSGKKVDRDSDIGVHIEHSIPVSLIRNLIIEQSGSLKSPEDVFNLILRFSLCTAFSRREETKFIAEGYASEHPQFSPNSETLCPSTIEPFKRYKPGIRIYSMTSGQEVKPSENLNTLNSYLKQHRVYSWSYLRSIYGQL